MLDDSVFPGRVPATEQLPLGFRSGATVFVQPDYSRLIETILADDSRARESN
jgi:hypothetical protein